MSETTLLLYVISFSLLGGVVSLSGGLLLLSNKRSAQKLYDLAAPFAAGALLAAAFVDLLPEALHDGEAKQIMAWTLIGILGFFLLERFLRYFHHHHDHGKTDQANHSLIIVGDTVHNIIDGIAIAAAFTIDPATGIVAAIAVAAHEIPQEIGDFGLLLKKGMTKRQVIVVNVLGALAATVAAVIFWLVVHGGESANISVSPILGLVAGFFVYIAVSDIIPSIHDNKSQAKANNEAILLMLGVIIVGVVTTVAHKYIDAGHDHNGTESHSYQGADQESPAEEHGDDHAESEADHEEQPGDQSTDSHSH